MFRRKFLLFIRRFFRLTKRDHKIARFVIRYPESTQEVIEGTDTWDVIRVKATDDSKDSIGSKFLNPVSDAVDSKVGHSDEGAKYFSLILSRSAGIGVIRG
jgi:hypothetical protein